MNGQIYHFPNGNHGGLHMFSRSRSRATSDHVLHSHRPFRPQTQQENTWRRVVKPVIQAPEKRGNGLDMSRCFRMFNSH